MKYFVLALFVAVASAAPTPDAKGEPVELIVHGVPAGKPLELGDIVGIKLKEHQDGELASSIDLLHPLTAAGIAEVAAAAEAAHPEIIPSPVQIVDNAESQPIPEVAIVPEIEETVPDIIAIMPIPGSNLQEPAPDAIAIMPIPESGPYEEVAPIELLPPVSPIVVDEQVGNHEEVEPIELLPPSPPVVIDESEVAPSPVVLPELQPDPASQNPSGEVFNNGLVQVQVNTPEDSGVLTTIQSWFSMIVNYISNGVQTSQQIV